MKIYRRAAIALASMMMMAGTMPVCAKELSQTNCDLGPIVKVMRASSSKTTPPSVSVTQKEIDDDYYLIITANDDDGIDAVRVDGSKVSDKYKGYSNKWQYEITKSGTYSIEVYDNRGNVTKTSYKASLKQDPTITLNKSTSGSNTYLTIKVTDDSPIKKVTVNDEKISFSSSGGTEKYKVTKSGKYTVEVTDNDGNTASESLTINLDDDEPTLNLSKKKISGKWYLIIDTKPNDGNKIATVKVNGKKVTCDKAGQEIQYEVTATGTYKVIVTDSEGLEATKSLYIDVKEGSNGPVLLATYIPTGNIGYINMVVSDDMGISKLTVNGTKVNIAANGGTTRYAVTASGTYTVVATDTEGNQVTQTVTANLATQQIPTTSYATTHKVVFKLNQKNWTLDGVANTMDSAAISRNNRIYIPLRYVANAVGVNSSQITWDSKTKTVVIYDGSNVIKVPLGKKTMTLNNKAIEMDTAAIQVNGRIMVPISQVAKAFLSRNVSLQWVKDTKEVIITRS